MESVSSLSVGSQPMRHANLTGKRKPGTEHMVGEPITDLHMCYVFSLEYISYKTEPLPNNLHIHEC